ncbi:MAG: ABC transporter ATP-binding protein [Thalassobaculales bacterium]
MSLLAVEGLALSAGGVPVVRGIGFSLARGGTLGIVGESGCGKSVTALSLIGLQPPAFRLSGSIRLDGRELVGLDEAALCALRGNRMAMVFQEPMTALNPVRRVGRQIAEPLVKHRGLGAAAARAEALRLMDKVRLPDAGRRIDAYPHELSGGQRQRVMIAIALACAPDLLIADEPTTALDVTVQAAILDLIADLVADDGMALLLISHDLGVIAETCAEVAVMYAGEIVESGPAEAIFGRPAHPYTRALFAALPDPGRRGRSLYAIPGTVPEPRHYPAGCAFAARCALAGPDCAAPPPATALSAGHVARCWRPGA